MPQSKKRKHQSSSPKPLGVLEFTSALNGDDPLQILQKLHQFVRVVQFQRGLVTEHRAGNSGEGVGESGVVDDTIESDASNAKCDNQDDDVHSSDDDDDDDVSYISFDEDDEQQDNDDTATSNKRQKLLQSTSTKKQKYSWKLDKNNYNVPFIGTSVTKGETGGPLHPANLTQWPTGFMEVYRRYSPLGVELNQNEFISALPPAGVHKMLCGPDNDGMNDTDGTSNNEHGSNTTNSKGQRRKNNKKKRGITINSQQQQTPQQTRGKIISITLQTKYWTAINEWILSFIPLTKLQHDLHWSTIDYTSTGAMNKSIKCAIPPQIMTVLMKQRMVEWITAIHNYITKRVQYVKVLQQHSKEHKQRLKQFHLKQSKLSSSEKAMEQTRLNDIQQKVERVQRRLRKEQSREEGLVLSALRCLNSLCYLSNGTAREVLRRLMMGGGSSNSSSGKEGVPSKSSRSGSNDGSGSDWMVQLFQQLSNSKSSSSIQPLVECVRLVCTLLETQDYIVLTRLTEVSTPSWTVKRGSGGKKDMGNSGMGRIVLRYGLRRLLDIARQSNGTDGEDTADNDNYAECIARFLRGVNGITLPSSQSMNKGSISGGKKDGSSGGFVLGMSATADLLSGEVLGSLAELSLFAPQFEPTSSSIQGIINGDDVYNDLDSIERAAVEARRLLFNLLVNTRRSPFLRDNSSSYTTEKEEDQFAAYLPQLSKALHTLLSGQGHSLPLKMMLGLCLRTTPEITPHFFRSLELSDPKPNYRSLAALTFVEGVVRDIPNPIVKVLRSGKMPKTEQVVSEIIPVCVTKTLLSKVLQSSCALLTSGGLKLIITLLRRACGVSFDDEDGSNCWNKDGGQNQFQTSIRKAVMSHMPELTILLSIPSRFDPFELSSQPSTAIVMLQLCEAFQCYAQIDPTLVVTAKYDWVKFLPLEEVSKRSFFNAEPLLQYRILRTLLVVSKLQQMSFSSKMLPSVLSIMTSTSVTTPEVYIAARELALSLLAKEIFPYFERSVESVSCQDYEASLWVDIISEDMIEDLMLMITEARQQSVQHKMTIFQALSETKLGQNSVASVSSLLTHSLSYLVAVSDESPLPFTKEFGLCLIQIATKMLLFQTSAKHFAALIAYTARGYSPTDKNAALLCQVATAIMNDRSNADIHLRELATTIFQRDCVLNFMLRMSDGGADGIPKGNFSLETMRQCLSILKYTKEEGCRERLLKFLRQIVVHICAVEGTKAAKEIQTILVESTFDIIDFEGIMLVTSSSLRSIATQRSDGDIESFPTKAYGEGMMGLSGIKVVSALLRQNIVPACDNSFTNDIWNECSTIAAPSNVCPERLKHFLLSVVLHMSPDVQLSGVSPKLATTMFHLWATLSNDLEDEVSLEVCVRLSQYLAEIFSSSKHGHLAWYVYQGLCNMGIDVFADCYFRTLLKTEEMKRTPKHCFLASVLSYGDNNFVCSMIKALAKNHDSYTTLWQSGLLDMTLYSLVVKVYSGERSDEGIELSKVAKIAGDRFTLLLRKWNENEGEVLSLEMITNVIGKLCSRGYCLSQTLTSVHDVFQELEKGQIVLSNHDQMQIVGLVVGTAILQQGEKDASLLAKVFMNCCKLIPKLLKKVIRTKGAEESVAKSLDVMIGYTSDLWEHHNHFIGEITSPSIIDNLIVSCLKYGMTDTAGFASSSVFGGCLKIIRLILAQTSDDDFSKVRSIKPSQVHAMVVSHSAFNVTIGVGKEESSVQPKADTISKRSGKPLFCEGLNQQHELIRLMLCCVSIDGSHVKIGTDTWSSILSMYDASTSVASRSLRRLLYLYDINNCCESEILLCDYQWGTLRKENHMSTDENVSPFDEEQRWEWLIDSLNFDRIRATLSQFPVSDPLVPLAEDGVEIHSENDNVKDSQMEVDSDDASEYSSSDGDDDLSNSTSASEGSFDEPNEVTHSSKIYSTADYWRGTGRDPRYSPGFILPLILGALEADFQKPTEDERCAELKGNKDEESGGEDSDDENELELARKQAFCMTARRLCDRGCISLAVASLSSRCPSVRRVAIAICGLFLRALQMKESHQMKSWRERPQQEMIMSSLQRGLAVRRAIQMKKVEATDTGIDFGSATTSKQRLNVTMLPALSAVFLAKALMILSRPSDDVYGAMNKYFLRLNDYRGAFQDCFSLPAFLSLYCSSSDDINRCRTERNWALLALKDSTVDEFCYRIISQHHVPELIMSSFDNLCNQQGGKNEVSLTIDVMRCLIQSGGRRSVSHMIERLGFLSWLHSVISWRNISFVLPQATLKCKYLGLISAAVESFYNICSTEDSSDGEESVFLEKIPLADAVIRICLDSSDAISNEFHTVVEAACETLWTIHMADKHDIIRRVGLTTLSQMTELLSKCVDDDKIFAQALISLSALPYSISGEEDVRSSARLFCELALSFMLGERVVLREADCVTILKRLCDLVRKFPMLRDDKDLVMKILQIRCLATSCRGIESWNGFIPFVNSGLV